MAGMSQKHSRHAGGWMNEFIKKWKGQFLGVLKITTLQQNTNWSILHIIIIQPWTWNFFEEALAEIVFLLRQMTADTAFHVAVMSSDISSPLRVE